MPTTLTKFFMLQYQNGSLKVQNFDKNDLDFCRFVKYDSWCASASRMSFARNAGTVANMGAVRDRFQSG
jgi:hypothetical protein